MNIKDCIEVVEKLLRQQKRNYKDSHEQLLYVRGYLTGFIARLMLTDPILRKDLEELIKHNK
jgi:hypothetical protein